MKASIANNPMMCDPVTGTCDMPGMQTAETNHTTNSKPVKLLYFTDPICSSCWGIEPQLRKLKLEYGNYLDIEYRMGGLLKGWDAYGGSDVSSPNDVAPHWDEASAYYDMPIDGDVWLEDPLHSSYPPSVAFKAAQMQSEEKALNFLRRMKEMLFLEKKNITKWEHVQEAALQTGLDSNKLKADFEGPANELFEADLAFAKQLGVRGFPTIFFTDEEGNRFLVYGSKPYENYEQALLKLYPQAKKHTYDTGYQWLFSEFLTLTTKEYSILAGVSKQEAEMQLEDLFTQGILTRSLSKNGILWMAV